MLRVSVNTVIVFYLLRESLCLDAEKDVVSMNITAEATSILECFTVAVDMPWQFADEELPWVQFFEHATLQLCDRNVWRIFECNYPLMKRFQQGEKLHDSSLREENEYRKTKYLEHADNSLKLQKQALHALDQLILLIQNIKLFADVRNETRILNDNCSKYFLDIDLLKNISTEFATEYSIMQIYIEILHIRSDILWYYMPPFIIVVFIVGMIGNGMLLLIFVRHPETRAGPNAMLVNLAISDTLFLFCNVALDYCKKLWHFPLGVTACYLYTFVLTLVTGGCVYSMTMLSFSRYMAVIGKPGKRRSSTPVMLTIVWILSSTVAIPDTLSTNTSEGTGNCGAENRLLNALCDLFLISLLPLTSITFFYVRASRRLIDSARNIPGEAIGQVKVKTARERGAKILPALAFVFAITYLPFYTLWAIITAFGINTSASPISHRLFYMAYFLFNLNSTLNPFALYAASGLFRKYFNRYLCLGFKQEKPDAVCQKKDGVQHYRSPDS